jgi:protein TonB
MRGTVGAALLFSAAAHAGALYWAVSALPPQEMALSAGASVAIDVVLVQGPGGLPARAAGEPEDAEKAEDRISDRAAGADASMPDRVVSADRRDSALAPEPSDPSDPPSFAPADPAAFTATHPAPETPQREPLDPAADVAVATPPPPPPRPDRPAVDSRPATQTAHVTATEPVPGAAAAPAGPAGESERTNDADGKQAASPRADNPAPAYPYAARLRGQQGRVLLQVEVLPSGDAGAVAVAQSSGYEGLDRAAQQAVRRWRFHPAQQNGHPVAASVQVPVRFALN